METQSVSNSGHLADFENNTPSSTIRQVAGLESTNKGEVAAFKMRVAEWYEVLPDAIMHFPHIRESLVLPESVCGNDDRILINSQNTPFRYICSLVITAQDGTSWIGSGFFIHQRCVITSGHCVFMKDNGGWAQKIQVIPGRDGNTAPFGSQISTNFRSVDGWVSDNNSDFDQGAIILPDNTLFNRIGGYFGYSELNTSTLLHNSGYPGDKPAGTQWYNAGNLSKQTDYKLEYMLDTAGGQSGTATYIATGTRSVVGVHGYGGCPNKAVRVRDYFFQRWPEWSRL